jgi:hypothetical protein
MGACVSSQWAVGSQLLPAVPWCSLQSAVASCSLVQLAVSCCQQFLGAANNICCQLFMVELVVNCSSQPAAASCSSTL